MKKVQFTVIFTGEIPDENDESCMILALDVSKVRIQNLPYDGEKFDKNNVNTTIMDVNGTILEYETLDVEILEDG
jgi:hypothetical protein